MYLIIQNKISKFISLHISIAKPWMKNVKILKKCLFVCSRVESLLCLTNRIHICRLSESISSCLSTLPNVTYHASSLFSPMKKSLLHLNFTEKKQVKNWAENFKFRLSTDDINELSLTPNGVQPTEPLSYQNPLFLLWQKTFLSEMGIFTDHRKKSN